MREAVTLQTILWNDVLSSNLVQFLDLEAKRNLRLVCHAGKDAVDKTVTAVSTSGEIYDVHSYLYSLAGSNWAGIKKIEFILSHYEPKLQAPAFILEGFDVRLKQAKWSHLESLSIDECPDDIAAIIAASDWPLKKLQLTGPQISDDIIQLLMQRSWVSTLESLNLDRAEIGEKGARAIAEASHRAPNLVQLSFNECQMRDKAACLADGSYPKLKTLDLCYNSLKMSNLAAILNKCPLVEDIDFLGTFETEWLDDPDDARILADVLRLKKRWNLEGLQMIDSGARHLFTCTDWPKLESLTLSYWGNPQHDDHGVVAALVQCNCPCLKELVLYDLEIRSEGNILFSNTEWPELETLKLDVCHSGLSLEPRNLPRLKSLELHAPYHSKTPNIMEVRNHLSHQFWPHLTELALLCWPTDPLNWGLNILKDINDTNMPSLRLLKFLIAEFLQSDRLAIEEEAVATSRTYTIQWSTSR